MIYKCATRLFLPILLLSLLSASAAAQQQQQQDEVVVVIEDAAIKTENKLLEQVHRANVLQVHGRRGDWSWATHRANGWIHRRHVVSLDEAMSYLAEEIRRNPHDPKNYNDRATVWFELGEYENAIADYARALQANPNLAAVHNNRAIAYYQLGDEGRAMADMNSLVRLRPRDPHSYNERGWLLHNQGRYELAAADYQRAADLNPNSPTTLGNQAWLWATCPEAELRDAEGAIEAASRACSMTDYQNGFLVGTLAAAYAEAGEFDKAVRQQTQAVELAPLEMKKTYRQRLALYKENKPLRARGKTTLETAADAAAADKAAAGDAEPAGKPASGDAPAEKETNGQPKSEDVKDTTEAPAASEEAANAKEEADAAAPSKNGSRESGT